MKKMATKKYKKLNFSVYDDLIFSAARILNLIDQIEILNLNQFLRFDDLHYIDFFASHPFLVFESNQKEYLELIYYGFSENLLEYANSRHIFSNQREKQKIVFALLISKDLIDIKFKKRLVLYPLTGLGIKIVNQFKNDYYKAYKLSAKYILNIIKKASQREIFEYKERWLDKSSQFLIH